MIRVLAAALALALPLLGSARAQTFPDHPLRIIVPFSPGGGADINARIFANRLSARIGQQVVVDNRAGAGGNIGTSAVARAEPDGYTLLLMTVATVVNPSIYPTAGYNARTDLVGVAFWSVSPIVFLSHPSVPVTSLRELVDLARARPGQLTFASGGTGAVTHIVFELLRQDAGIDMVHVVYRGQAPAVVDLLAGQVNLMADSVASALPHLRSGRVRGIAVTSPERSSLAPDVPTTREAGFPNVTAGAWYGIGAPTRTPAPVTATLNAAINDVLRQDATRQDLAAVGAEPFILSAEAYAAFLETEGTRWAAVARAANIRAE